MPIVAEDWVQREFWSGSRPERKNTGSEGSRSVTDGSPAGGGRRPDREAAPYIRINTKVTGATFKIRGPFGGCTCGVGASVCMYLQT